jgi:hypothetical protein
MLLRPMVIGTRRRRAKRATHGKAEPNIAPATLLVGTKLPVHGTHVALKTSPLTGLIIGTDLETWQKTGVNYRRCSVEKVPSEPRLEAESPRPLFFEAKQADIQPHVLSKRATGHSRQAGADSTQCNSASHTRARGVAERSSIQMKQRAHTEHNMQHPFATSCFGCVCHSRQGDKDEATGSGTRPLRSGSGWLSKRLTTFARAAEPR